MEDINLTIDEVDLEYPEEKYSLPEDGCPHCGGIMRYYRGTVSCLLCGRNIEHRCQYCVNKKAPVEYMAAPSSESAVA